MMKPLQNLPANYHLAGSLDLKKNKPVMVVMNVAALVLMIPSGWFFLYVLTWLRPSLVNSLQGSFSANLWEVLWLILVVLVTNFFMLILHEAIHGACFWIFTKAKPVYGLKTFYAFAAAPDWYLPRNQYLLTSLAPLICISILCVFLLAFVPEWMIAAVLVLAVCNTAGSIGDIVVAVWLLFQPKTCLANDRGDAFSLYLPG